jgi:hypothetical protein
VIFTIITIYQYLFLMMWNAMPSAVVMVGVADMDVDAETATSWRRICRSNINVQNKASPTL